MLKNRVIPVILLRNGAVVQSKAFRRYQHLGNPMTIVSRLSNWAADELIYLDISREKSYDLRRDDLGDPNEGDLLSILGQVSRRCFMPMSFGGGIRTMDDIADRLSRGADKVVINTQALLDPPFIESAARVFGSQCVVVCLDARSARPGKWEVSAFGGDRPTGRLAADWAHEAQERGAGEILIQSIDQDGAAQGYDLALVRSVVQAVGIPVIALGGVGDWSHLHDGLREGASAVAAANIFNYSENSVFKAKEHLFASGANVRAPSLGFGARIDEGERVNA
jgi:cyclase